jgi:hypothetical protein
MPESEGAWAEPVTDSEPAAPSAAPADGLEGEFDLLEARVLDAAILIQQLRDDRDSYAREREALLLDPVDLK